MWDSLPQSGSLQTNPSLTRKVSGEGLFLPFWGDTIIFDLPQPMLAWLARIQNDLYRQASFCLSHPLPPESFHITLHDLTSSPEGMPEDSASRQEAAEALLLQAQRQYLHGIRLRSCCVFSMVSTSIVMGFEPAEEADCQALMSLYEQFQTIVPLPYPLTLHATLAYYRPGFYPEENLRQLRETLSIIGRDRTEWTLPAGSLHYARFDSMQRYDG